MTATRKLQPRKGETRHFVLVACGALQGQNLVFFFRGCNFLFISPKPKRRDMQKCKGHLGENSHPKSPKLPKILSQTCQDPSQTLPKPFQNQPPTSKIEGKSNFSDENKKGQEKIGFPQCPSPSWMSFWTPKASQERPKSLPKAAKIEPKTWKKRCLNISRFQTRIFYGFDLVFGGILNDFWKPKCAQVAKIPFWPKPEK